MEETVLVPMLKYLLVLFQKRLELFWFKTPPVPAKRILPGVKVARVALPRELREKRDVPVDEETLKTSAVWPAEPRASRVIKVVLELAF